MSYQNFVLDCSATMARVFEDERTPYIREVFTSLNEVTAYVPLIWSLEVDNVLLVNEKRSRVSHQEIIIFKQILKKLPIIKDNAEDDFYELAREFKLTTYDASYLELALRKKIPIATLDKALRHAAKQCKLDLYLE